jgi:DNA-binding phage protein
MSFLAMIEASYASGATMTIKSVSYHPSLIDRLKNPVYAAAFLNAILEEAEPEADLLKSALLDISEALGTKMATHDLQAHQARLNTLLKTANPLSIADLMTWLEPFGLRLLVMASEATESLPAIDAAS